MWFKDEEGTGRRSTARRRFRGRTTLKVNARLSTQRKIRGQRVVVFILVPAVLVAAGVLLWLGLRLAGDVLFSGNGRFTMTHIDIRSGGDAVRDYITGKKGIREGGNLFGFSLSQLRKDFLRDAPTFKAIYMRRRLPGTLEIETVERRPVARIGGRGPFVVDEEGLVFGLPRSLVTLPVISGYRATVLKPGSRVQGMAVAALQVLDACDDPGLGVRVGTIEVDRGDFLILRLLDGKAAKLAWAGMGSLTPASRECLLGKLRGLSSIQLTAAGRRLSVFDLTLEGDRITGQ